MAQGAQLFETSFNIKRPAKKQECFRTSAVFLASLIWTMACRQVDPPTSPSKENCEVLLETTLVSPASFHIIEARESDWQDETKDVTIVYDADNAFGASLRGTVVCSYLPDPDWWRGTGSKSDMRTNAKQVRPNRLLPYKLVIDGEAIGGSKTEPSYDALKLLEKASDLFRRREAMKSN